MILQKKINDNSLQNPLNVAVKHFLNNNYKKNYTLLINCKPLLYLNGFIIY